MTACDVIYETWFIKVLSVVLCGTSCYVLCGIVMLCCYVVLWYMKGFNVFHKSVVCSVVWHELQC